MCLLTLVLLAVLVVLPAASAYAFVENPNYPGNANVRAFDLNESTSVPLLGPAAYGRQCVEYVDRFYYYAMGYSQNDGTVTNAWNWSGNGADYFGSYAGKGLVRFSNGGSIPPRAGDILCFGGGAGGYGHVAIVVSVGASYVRVVQQNAPLGRASIRDFAMTTGGGAYSVSASWVGSSYWTQGWLRSARVSPPPSAVTASVRDPSFEQWSGTNLVDWSFGSSAGGHGVQVTGSDFRHSGGSAVEVTAPTGNSGLVSDLIQAVNVTPGFTYTLGVWAISDRNPGSVQLHLQFVNAQGVALSAPMTTGTSWGIDGGAMRQMFVSGVAPAGAVRVNLYLRLAGGYYVGPGGGTTAGRVVWDDVTLVAAAPYLYDPSFEAWLSPSGPRDWGFGSNAGGVLSRVGGTDFRHSGSFAAATTAPTGNTALVSDLVQAVTVTPGWTYTLGAWVITDRNAGAVSLHIQFLNQQGVALSAPSTTGSQWPIGSGSMGQMFVTGVAPPGAMRAVLYLRLSGGSYVGPGGGSIAGRAVWDDVTFTGSPPSVQDPSFEAWSSANGLANWGFGSIAGGVLSRVGGSDFRHSGIFAAATTAPTGNTALVSDLVQAVTVTPGWTYTLGAWVITDRNPGAVQLHLQFLNQQGIALSAPHTTGLEGGIDGGAMRQMFVTGTAPSGAVRANLYLRLSGGTYVGPGGGTAGGRAVWDDVTFLGSATPPTTTSTTSTTTTTTTLPPTTTTTAPPPGTTTTTLPAPTTTLPPGVTTTSSTTTSTTSTTLPPAEGRFADVSASHPYRTAIEAMGRLNIVAGSPQPNGTTLFRPENPLLRAQFAKLVCGAFSLDVDESLSTTFTDMGLDNPEDLYPHDYVAAAAQAGVIRGKSSREFAPWDDVTRAQMITMVVRAAQNRAPGLLATPPDSFVGTKGDFSPTHGENLRIAEYNGLLQGLQGFGPSWDPWDPTTRGEVAQVLYRWLGMQNGALLASGFAMGVG